MARTAGRPQAGRPPPGRTRAATAGCVTHAVRPAGPGAAAHRTVLKKKAPRAPGSAAPTAPARQAGTACKCCAFCVPAGATGRATRTGLRRCEDETKLRSEEAGADGHHHPPLNRVARRGLLVGAAAAAGTAALAPAPPFATAAPPHPVAAALRPGLFRSFFLGGFECSAHRRADGRRHDLLAATRHDALAEQDYRQLVGHGIRAARRRALPPRRGRRAGRLRLVLRPADAARGGGGGRAGGLRPVPLRLARRAWTCSRPGFVTGTGPARKGP